MQDSNFWNMCFSLWERSCYGRSVTLVPCFVGYLCFTFCDTLFYKPGVVRSSRRLCARVVWLEDSFFCHNHSWSPSCGLCESLRKAKNRFLKLYVGFFLRYLQKKKLQFVFKSGANKYIQAPFLDFLSCSCKTAFETTDTQVTW